MTDDPKPSGQSQTSEQAAVTDLGPQGRTDDDRARERPEGRTPPSPGGSSQGQSDRKPSAR